ncbi:hypothetical protein A2Z22_05295 [Candidatus Woesebacteria bacterium RBG_16_34_12]|uniref:Uncharacterized protein n=1 Tax=Candidatus Woesebacteria bacterium RBG_16_34_12 TaxID=1802480 RepID=A0A1F7X710_9BACT|nr:MAG: hypothetical protein A2Z22_05295 [Candidatus Woesebacteria bacterium RBG_16_34_12]
MKKLKILFINDYGYQLGGVEISILNQVLGLKKRRHTVKIFTSDNNPSDKPLFSNYTFKGYNEKSPLRWFNRVFYISSYLKLKQVLREYEPDIIHLHNIFYQVSPTVLLAVRNTPTVFTLHSYELICPTGVIIKQDGSRCVTEVKHDLRCTGSVKGYIYEKIKQEIHRLLFKKVTMYIAPSESIKKDFTNQRIISSPIKVIYNGIELSKYEPILNFNRILYVGRLSKEKGVEVLLKATNKIKEVIPNIRVDIVGDGPETEHLKSLCKSLDLQNTVFFSGKIENNDVIDYYKNCTFLVVPSICPESFSLTGVEALSIGRPVIGSNLGAIPEWLIDKKCGYLFTPESVSNLVEKSLVLLKNKPVLLRMSKFGYKYSRKFSTDINTNNIEGLYFELTNKTL